MRHLERAVARRQIDNRLKQLGNPDVLACPPRGWVKAIREALGMTAVQLGRRLGVSQQRALALEKAEASGALTLQSLERAAQALDCRLVYVLVPRKPLDAIIAERADKLARRQLRATSHSMALEAQAVEAADEEAQRERLTRQLIEGPGSALWQVE